MQMKDRVAVITGGKRIGCVVAAELASRGVDVVVSYRSSKKSAKSTVDDIRSHGGRAVAVQADVTCAADCNDLMSHAVAEFGRIDILVNMASTYRRIPFDELTEAIWDQDLGSNLKSAYLCALAVVPHMRAVGGGRIINFSDWLAQSGRPRYFGFIPYYVAKAGTVALTESLALELAKDSILVSAIAPGPIIAPSGSSEAEIEEVAKATPIGRWGGSMEIAKVVVGLIESDFITGETIRVDGGRHLN